MLLPHPAVTDQLFALESRRDRRCTRCHSTIVQNPFSPSIRSTDSPVGANCPSQARVSCASSNDSQRDELLEEMLILSSDALISAALRSTYLQTYCQHWTASRDDGFTPRQCVSKTPVRLIMPSLTSRTSDVRSDIRD